MRNSSVQLLHLLFFHPPRNLTNNHAGLLFSSGCRVQVCRAGSQLQRQPVLIPSWASSCLDAWSWRFCWSFMFISTCVPQGRATTARKGRESLDLNCEHQNSSNGFLLSIYIPCLSGKKKKTTTTQNPCVSLGQKPTCQWLCWGSRLTMAFKRAVEPMHVLGIRSGKFLCMHVVLLCFMWYCPSQHEGCWAPTPGWGAPQCHSRAHPHHAHPLGCFGEKASQSASRAPLREKTCWQVSVLSCSYLIYCESHLFWFRQCW